MNRTIDLVYRITEKYWVGNGFHVQNYFPSGKNLLKRFSPFAVLDYQAPEHFAPSDIAQGIGPHPHRGIETVTFAIHGAIEHHDNQGNHGVIYPGDIQWMTAGAGIMHKEYHEQVFNERGGLFQMIQLWINLPAKDKFTKPAYQTITCKMMQRIEPSEGVAVILMAGQFGDYTGPAKTFSPINIYTISLADHAKITLNEPEHYNVGFLVTSGEVLVGDQACTASDFVLLDNVPGTVEITGVTAKSQLLVLSGAPLDEPVIAKGPFVMNTPEQIKQAFEDYKNGQFGTAHF